MIHLPKTQQAPASLAVEKDKTNGSYREQDVISQLENDFKNKCYLCEEKELTSINVEHFISHKGNKDLKFDWKNLFLACPHCNNTKRQLVPKSDNILNCTIFEDGVDTKISYYLHPFPKETVSIIVKETDDVRVINTATLLDAIYNGKIPTTPEKRLESNNLRKRLLKEIKQFQALLENYVKIDADKKTLKIRIEKELSSESAFTAFKRWIIRDNEIFSNEFSF